MNKPNIKLQTVLIEQGKEVEAMKHSPTLAEMEDRFEQFKIAIQSNDMRRQRIYGRQLTAMVTKYIIENL